MWVPAVLCIDLCNNKSGVLDAVILCSVCFLYLLWSADQSNLEDTNAALWSTCKHSIKIHHNLVSRNNLEIDLTT